MTLHQAAPVLPHALDHKSIFICYAREDAGVAELADRLLRAGGAAVFRDQTDLALGDSWQETIDNTIQKCDRLLLFWSHAAASSPWVRREIKLALKYGKQVVPILLDEAQLPRRLSRLHGLSGLRDLLREAQTTETRLFSTLGRAQRNTTELRPSRYRRLSGLARYIKVRYMRRGYALLAALLVMILAIGIASIWLLYLLFVWYRDSLGWVTLIPIILGIVTVIVARTLAMIGIITINRWTEILDAYCNRIDIEYFHTGFVAYDAKREQAAYEKLGFEFVSTVFAYSRSRG